MISDLEQHDAKFMAVLMGNWSVSRTDIAVDASASWIGGKIGYSIEQTTAVVHSLIAKGLLHARDVQGVLLIHPSKMALDTQKPRNGLLANAFALLSGLYLKNRR